MAFKKGDFVELDYTGRRQEDKKVFDTTKKEVATKEGITTNATFEPVTIVLGEHHILPAIDEFLIGKDVGQFTLDLTAEQAFGKKDAKLLRLVPLKLFKKENIQPFVGLEITIDNQPGTVRSISGARIIVDFNHPLAGQDISYELDVKKKVEDKKIQVEAVLKLIGLKPDKVTLTDNKATIFFEQKLDEEPEKVLKEQIKKLTGLDVSFSMTTPETIKQ